MGEYDAQIANAKRALSEAEAELTEAKIQMADSPANVRDFVLGNIQEIKTESRWMIETYESAN